MPVLTAHTGAMLTSVLLIDLNEMQHNTDNKTMRRKELVGRVGFEPTTNWLKANCSTTELTTLMGSRIIRLFQLRASINFILVKNIVLDH